MFVRERERMYARGTGLTRTAVRDYRTSPVATWTTTADRQIGSSIRALEGLASDDDLPWGDWKSAARSILREIRGFLDGVFETVARFAERMRDVFTTILTELKAFLSHETVKAIVGIVGILLLT